MPLDLSNYNVIIAVFAMPECPACDDFVPRFNLRAESYKQAGIPILLYDVSSPDNALQDFADKYKVRATPTTVVLPRGGKPIKMEGALGDAQIDRLLRHAYGIHTGRGR